MQLKEWDELFAPAPAPISSDYTRRNEFISYVSGLLPGNLTFVENKGQKMDDQKSGIDCLHEIVEHATGKPVAEIKSFPPSTKPNPLPSADWNKYVGLDILVSDERWFGRMKYVAQMCWEELGYRAKVHHKGLTQYYPRRMKHTDMRLNL